MIAPYSSFSVSINLRAASDTLTRLAAKLTILAIGRLQISIRINEANGSPYRDALASPRELYAVPRKTPSAFGLTIRWAPGLYHELCAAQPVRPVPSRARD